MAGLKYGKGDFVKLTKDFEKPYELLIFRDTIGTISGDPEKIDGKNVYGFLEAGFKTNKPVKIGEEYLEKVTEKDLELLRQRHDLAQIKLDSAKVHEKVLRETIKSLEASGRYSTVK